jgi:hypothetical protein
MPKRMISAEVYRTALIQGMHMHQPTLNTSVGGETLPEDRVDPDLRTWMCALVLECTEERRKETFLAA